MERTGLQRRPSRSDAASQRMPEGGRTHSALGMEERGFASIVDVRKMAGSILGRKTKIEDTNVPEMDEKPIDKQKRMV